MKSYGIKINMLIRFSANFMKRFCVQNSHFWEVLFLMVYSIKSFLSKLRSSFLIRRDFLLFVYLKPFIYPFRLVTENPFFFFYCVKSPYKCLPRFCDLLLLYVRPFPVCPDFLNFSNVTNPLPIFGTT